MYHEQRGHLATVTAHRCPVSWLSATLGEACSARATRAVHVVRFLVVLPTQRPRARYASTTVSHANIPIIKSGTEPRSYGRVPPVQRVEVDECPSTSSRRATQATFLFLLLGDVMGGIRNEGRIRQ